jgi:MFS family permease
MNAAGPVAAGLLIAAGGWRAVFIGESVAAVIAGVIALALLTESRDPVPGRDISGQVLAAVSLSSLVFALIDGQDHGFTSPLVATAWALAAIALVAFVVVEKRSPYAVVDLRLFRDRLAAAGLVAATASTFALFSVLLLVSLDLQVVGGYSGLATAGVFTPMTVVMVLAGPIGGRWTASRGPMKPLICGLLIAAVALGVLDHSLGRPVAVLTLAGWLALMGIGLGLVVAPMVGVVLSRVPAERSGMAAAAVTAAREVGGVVGVSALGAVLYARLFSGLTRRLVDIGIPVGYRQIVIDAVRKGTKIPTGSGVSPGGQGQNVPFLSKLVASIRQALVDRTVDAGKAAYVAAVRSALVVAVIMLVAGAVGVALLLGQRDRDPDTLPETVRAGV